jgi:cbb3-type cytochrome oxidase subunit 3
MRTNLIKATLIGLIIIFIGYIFSAVLGTSVGSGDTQNENFAIIFFAILFLSGIVSSSTYLILKKLNNHSQ